MKDGRPTKYNKEFCKTILEGEFVGLLVLEIANRLGVVEDTLHEWAKQHKEFSVALDRARENCKNFYLEKAKNNLISYGDVRVNEKTLHLLMAVSGVQRKLHKLAALDNEFDALREIQRGLSAGEIDDKYAETATKVVLAKLQAKKDTEMFNDIKLIKEKLGLE